MTAFFDRDRRFFLTGGAALVKFYLGHRETVDLDLFTLEDVIESGFRNAAETARALGCLVESIQTAPDFRRILVTRGDESVIVDLVREYTFQLDKEKREIDGIRVDSAEEILANKLCALLSRSEIRDLVDVFELEKSGFSVENFISIAQQKDSGLTPSQLAWVLSQIQVGDDAVLPGGITAVELRRYINDLIDRLTRLGFPSDVAD